SQRRIRLRRKRSFTNEQMLEIARTAIDEAVSDQSEVARKAVSRLALGYAAPGQRASAFRVPRRPPWPGGPESNETAQDRCRQPTPPPTTPPTRRTRTASWRRRA